MTTPTVKISTRAPVATGCLLWRARRQLYASVAVKAKLGLVHERAMELVEPVPLVTRELHHRDNPMRSIRATTELVPYLGRTDVVLTGHACAPHGQTAEKVSVRLAVLRGGAALLDKKLDVQGDRKKGVIQPFDKMPIVYERALGGVGWDDNPLGAGCTSVAEPDLGAVNVLDPANPRRTAGFGPISRIWPARRRLLGQMSRKALDEPIIEVPDGFDWSYFHAAPADQRIELLRGDEEVVIEGFHPYLPQIRSRLPAVRVSGSVAGLSPGGARALQLALDTLRIDADEQSCTAVWRSVVPVRDEAALGALEVAIGLELGGEWIEWAEEPAAAGVESPETIDLDDAEADPTIDDAAPTIAIGDRKPAEKKPAPAEKRPAPPPADATVVLDPDAPPPPEAPMPVAGRIPRPAAKHDVDGTFALSLDDHQAAAHKGPLPFDRNAPPASRRRFVARSVPGAPWSQETRSVQAPTLKRMGDDSVTIELDALDVVDEATAPLPELSAPAVSPPRPQAVSPPAPPRPAAVPSVPPPRPQTVPSVPPPRPQAVSPPAPPRPPAVPSTPPPRPQAVSPPAPPRPPAVPSTPPPRPPAVPPPSPARPPATPAAAQAPGFLPPAQRAQDSVPVAGTSPFATFTMPWQLKAGRDTLVVIVKATCDLAAEGRSALREEPDPPSGDVHENDDPMGTALYPTDFVPFKQRADVVLTGHAYAPGGSSPAAQVGFRFGERKNTFERRIAVLGERRWLKAGVKLAPTEPKPFKKVPLVYERAFGGPGFDRNPAGVGRDTDRLPQLEDPASLMRSPGDTPAPMCFAAVPMRWPGRWGKLGTFDAAWKKNRWPYLPDDLDLAFFQAAPPEQQLEHLTGDEPYEIVGMHAEHPVLSGRLPGVRPRCFAQKTGGGGGDFHEVLLRLDTAVFDVDAMKVTLVWRGGIDVRDDDASDVAELFVFAESIKGPVADRAAALARYRQERTPAPEDPLEEEAANDALPPAERPPAEAAALHGTVLAMLATPGASFAGMELADVDLSGLDLSGRSFEGAILTRAKLRGAKLRGADLSGAQLGGADLVAADLSNAVLTGADLTRADLTDAVLAGASVGDALFLYATGDRARFDGARGEHASFEGGSWKKARFTSAELTAADFSAATLDGADLSGAALPDVRLYDAKGTAASFRGATLSGARADGASLTRCFLQEVTAPSSVWDRATLDESTFFGATMPECGLSRASCRRTIFSGADLTSGRLRRGKFEGATFRKANLMGATLEAARLDGADLRGANLHGAELLKAKLDGAQLELAIVTQTKLASKS